MPLIIIAGKPCTGKTTIATQLADFIRSKRCTATAMGRPENSGDSNSSSNSSSSGNVDASVAPKVELINEECLSISKAAGYRTASDEKCTRGSLKSATEQRLSSDSSSYVIVDSMNYIKGFRYELYCAARSSRSAHCVLWVDCADCIAQQWNQQRAAITISTSTTTAVATTATASTTPTAAATTGSGAAITVAAAGGSGDAYDPMIMQELRRRFEAPNESNRWDAPLFKIASTPEPTSDSKGSSSSSGGSNSSNSGSSSSSSSSSNGNSCISSGGSNINSGGGTVIVDEALAAATAAVAIDSNTAAAAASGSTFDNSSSSQAPKATAFKSSWRPKKIPTAATAGSSNTNNSNSSNNINISNNSSSNNSISGSSSIFRITSPATRSNDAASNGTVSSNSSVAVGSVSFSGTTATAADEQRQRDEFQLASSSGDVHRVFDRIWGYFQGASAPLPNSSTVSLQHAAADLLHELDRTSSRIVQSLLLHQQAALCPSNSSSSSRNSSSSNSSSSNSSSSNSSSNSSGSGVGATEDTSLLPLPPLLQFAEFDRALQLPREVSAVELQRWRRQFVKLNAQHPPPSAAAVGASFVDFLAAQLAL